MAHVGMLAVVVAAAYLVGVHELAILAAGTLILLLTRTAVGTGLMTILPGRLSIPVSLSGWALAQAHLGDPARSSGGCWSS